MLSANVKNHLKQQKRKTKTKASALVCLTSYGPANAEVFFSVIKESKKLILLQPISE